MCVYVCIRMLREGPPPPLPPRDYKLLRPEDLWISHSGDHALEVLTLALTLTLPVEQTLTLTLRC